MNHLKEVNVTGGATIGMMRASWPLVTLKCNKERLEIKAFILGRFIFTSADIISIKSIPSLLGGSVLIQHRVENYNRDIFFHFFGGSEDLIGKIRETGFLNNERTEPGYLDLEIAKSRLNSGFPIKMSAMVVVILIWNLFLLSDVKHFLDNDVKGFVQGTGMKMALTFMIAICLVTLTVAPFRKLILKEGRGIDDVKMFLYLIIAIATILLIANFSF